MSQLNTANIITSNTPSISLKSLPPLSLYIHIPWCIKKCPYCDFNSHAFDNNFPEQEYINALVDDLQSDLHYIQGRSLQSIFIGGGTPSLFSAESFSTLLSSINSFITFADDIEITLEANPGTFEQNKFSEFRAIGLNRLSIGIQSFQADFLKKLGRVHSDKEALLAPEIALQAGFDNFNLDFMFGLPEQTSQQAIADLKQAINYNPSHISWYQLTIEPNTAFYSKPLALPANELIESMHEEGINLLNSAGFNRYEISAFSNTDRQSKHNLNYWQFGDYLGIGAGAHGKITLLNENKIIRTRRTKQPQAYLDPHKDYLADISAIPEQDLVLEFMMNTLRLNDGVTEKLLHERTGINLKQVSSIVDELRSDGLLKLDSLCATTKGYNLLNTVLQAFMT